MPWILQLGIHAPAKDTQTPNRLLYSSYPICGTDSAAIEPMINDDPDGDDQYHQYERRQERDHEMGVVLLHVEIAVVAGRTREGWGHAPTTTRPACSCG